MQSCRRICWMHALPSGLAKLQVVKIKCHAVFQEQVGLMYVEYYESAAGLSGLTCCIVVLV